jgi:AcrR family transcriptional regulator
MDQATPTGLARLWQPAESQDRRPRLGLSLDRVVDAAIAIADVGGLEAVSMARVAERLGFTTMSLYRYVASKDELLLFMRDRAWFPSDYTDDDARPWRPRIADWTVQMRATLLRHIWLEQVRTTERLGTPSQLFWQDRGLATLEETPLREHEKSQVLLLLNAHVFHDARVISDFMAAERSGKGYEETAGAYFALIRQVTADGRYPALRRAVEAGAFADVTDTEFADIDTLFRFGLDCILDGVEVLVARRV